MYVLTVTLENCFILLIKLKHILPNDLPIQFWEIYPKELKNMSTEGLEHNVQVKFENYSNVHQLVVISKYYHTSVWWTYSKIKVNKVINVLTWMNLISLLLSERWMTQILHECIYWAGNKRNYRVRKETNTARTEDGGGLTAQWPLKLMVMTNVYPEVVVTDYPSTNY